MRAPYWRLITAGAIAIAMVYTVDLLQQAQEGEVENRPSTTQPAKVNITISKDTTYITGPLNKDGTVNYVAYLNAIEPGFPDAPGPDALTRITVAAFPFTGSTVTGRNSSFDFPDRTGDESCERIRGGRRTPGGDNLQALHETG